MAETQPGFQAGGSVNDGRKKRGPRLRERSPRGCDRLASQIARESNRHKHPAQVAVALTDHGRFIALAFFACVIDARRHLLAGGAA